MPSTNPETLARESIAAFNRSDWPALLATLAPGFVYEETGTGRRIAESGEFVAALEGWKSAFPDVVGDIRRLVVDGDSVVVEIVWSGTQTGPLDTGAGVVPASGRHGEFWAVMWLETRDGVIVSERHHLDVLTLLANIGAIPAPAAT